MIHLVFNGNLEFSELAETQLVYVDRKSFLIDQLLSPGAGSFLTIAGIIYLLLSGNQRKFRFLALVVIAVVVSLMLMKGKSYYTQGIFPFLISAGAVFYESVLKKWYTRLIFVSFLLLVTYPLIPYGLPVYKTEGLIKYFDMAEARNGFDVGRTFEDGSKHSLPQDYADMLGWEELTRIAARAWEMIPDKQSAFIYCENYGQTGAITIIGKKYGLPEPISFHESFRYWIPEAFNPDITSVVYINNDPPGEDVKGLFANILKVGSISDPDAREYGTAVYLCTDPVISFNSFWKKRLIQLESEN